MKYLVLVFFIFSVPLLGNNVTQDTDPVRVAVIGLVHGHAHWIFGREDKGDIEIVAIVEPYREVALAYSRQYGFSMEMVYDDMEIMFERVKPEAVTAFNTIAGHVEVVRQAGPRGVHVMVEKPLAASLSDAKIMKRIADKTGIILMTNYETSWYPTTYKTLEMVKDSTLGSVRKILVNDGHQGPEEIGVGEEFLSWLIDPDQNGAGALTDFGCYGANLVTSIMNNEKPTTVLAVTQQIKPDKYPLVEDEATIVLTYPKAQAIIQASWNWTFSRKDMAVYGTKSYARTVDGNNMYHRASEGSDEVLISPDSIGPKFHDPFSYFAGAIRGEIEIEPGDLGSLSNNMIVMEILDAAMRSAKEGRSILLR